MPTVHAQVYVRDSALRVVSRLPRRIECNGLTIDIAERTTRERLVVNLSSIRHECRWTLGEATGLATLDIVRSGSALTEMILRAEQQRRRWGWTELPTRPHLQHVLAELRKVISAPEANVVEVIPQRAVRGPWRTPA